MGVEIIIPDIMEMQEIHRAEDEIKKRFELYCVSSIEELQEKQEEYEEAYHEYEKADNNLRIILNGESWEAIKKEYE